MNYWERRKVTRRTLLRGTGMGLASGVAIAVLGCGDSGSKPEAGSDAAPRAAATSSIPTAADASQARRGGKLRMVTANGDSADTHTATHPGAQQSLQFALDQLSTLDEPVPGDLTVAPMLAERIEQPDDLTYIYHLRNGVKFQNVEPVSGRLFTAEDAAFSLRRMGTDDPRFTRRSWLATVNAYEVVDPRTLRITMKEPAASFTYLVANPWVGMIGKEQVDRDGGQLKTWIGTGPYTVTRLELNSILQFTRNPTYWGAPGPYFDEVERVTIDDPQARISAFRADQIKLTDVPNDQFKTFKDQNKDATAYQFPSGGIGIVAMKTSRPPYNNPLVRRAIAQAADVAGWIETTAGGLGTPTGPIFQAFKRWALPPDQLKFHQQNIAEAKKMLDAAGVDPKSLSLKAMSIANVPRYMAVAGELKADLKLLGVEMEVVGIAQNDYTNRLYVTGDIEMIVGEEFSPDDPDRLYEKFHSKGSGNYSSYANPELDQLLAQQRRTLNYEERKALVAKAQKILVDDVPTFYTYVLLNNVFVRGVANWRVTATVANDTRWGARNAWLTG